MILYLDLARKNFDLKGNNGDPNSSTLCIMEGNIQSPLGFATLDKAAALGLATATPLTDLRQYINSDLGYSDLEI